MMKITIIGSMTFVDKMLEAKKILEDIGHIVFISNFVQKYTKLSKEKIEMQTVFDKTNNGGLTELCFFIEKSDSVLALNYNKRKIRNYIGGNTFLELGYAYILGKKIYFLNPIPKMLYTSELQSMKPIILGGKIENIK